MSYLGMNHSINNNYALSKYGEDALTAFFILLNAMLEQIQLKSINNEYYIVQTKDDYKAIMHFTDKTELVNIRPDIIEEIKDLLEKEV